jgi:hypothetical protein
MESGRMEKSMYDREVAWTVAGGEISIEEVRAMVRCSYVNKKVAIPIDADNPPEIWKCRRIAPKPVQKPKVQPVVAPQPTVRSQVSLLRGLLIYFSSSNCFQLDLSPLVATNSRKSRLPTILP